ncbi:hypothetical protein Dsin_001506 [Dipteronia sinensis]|uniref:Reverse transcriptase zinc-binding domain-containing protein n=1 Tax=Dipteronia sinensis TaxID=43782 RepID=A0AAE0B5G0_9ROSI|nr:hypothetical protein Dsin_001506 [Dipteronia sinensis]
MFGEGIFNLCVEVLIRIECWLWMRLQPWGWTTSLEVFISDVGRWWVTAWFLLFRIFFHRGAIFSGLNSSFIVLLLKLKDSISIDQFRLTVLSNFLFKISSKILADRLSRIAARIVSPHQFGFIWEHDVEDCIALAFDCVNMLQKKCCGDWKIAVFGWNDDWAVAFLLLSGPFISWLYSQSNLSLADLGLLNDSLLRKLTWKFMTSKGFAYSFMHERRGFFDFIQDDIWVLNECLRARFPNLCFRIDRIAISPVADSLVQARSRDGRVSCKMAYSQMINGFPQVLWWRDVWSCFIPPYRSALTWHLLLNRPPTEDRLCRGGFQLVSRCSVCCVSSELADHLFLQCPLVATLWKAVFSTFQRQVSTNSWSASFSQAMSVTFSDYVDSMEGGFPCSCL